MEATTAVTTPVATEAPASTGRPTVALPWPQLLNISVYWLGINVIWAGLGYTVFFTRFKASYGDTLATTYVGLIDFLALPLSVIVQPTVAVLSDYTMTRWGRRKPYIFIGALLDLVFLWGLATSNTFVSILVFLVLLQISSNFAQGPFQGYVPDLVPDKQVGTASGLMGLMIIIGQVVGTVISTVGVVAAGANPYPLGTPEAGEFVRQAFVWPTLGLGVIEAVTMVPLVLFVREGRAAPDRGGRSWLQIALSAWGTDILRQRSYVWLLVSRLFFLTAAGVLTFLGLPYLERALGLGPADEQVAWPLAVAVLAVTTGLATIPAARLSDRIGRKRTIYVACLLGAIGMAGLALAPNLVVMLVAVGVMGVSIGNFLAVDWALMTDIIPKATTGRYMGISNVATALSGPLGRITIGPLLTVLILAGLPGALWNDNTAGPQSTLYAAGPRISFALMIVLFAISAWALRHVDERRRED